MISVAFLKNSVANMEQISHAKGLDQVFDNFFGKLQFYGSNYGLFAIFQEPLGFVQLGSQINL